MVWQVMKKDLLQSTRIAALFCAAVLLVVPACRSTPVTRPTIPEIPPEGPEASPPKVELPTETSAPESPPKTASQPIPRLLPESLISPPEKEIASRRLEYNTMISSRAGESASVSGWQYRRTRQGQIVGFEFSNRGGNRILPPRRDALKNQLFTRDFQFRFDERARQDIHLAVADWAPSRDRQFRLSELMNSLLHFFPRNYLPAIVSFEGRNFVTLPTGEEVQFDAKTLEILSGVLAETPVDLNPDRAARKFPGIEYLGRGVLVRADARGSDPRIGTTATITTGSPPAGCERGTDCDRCQIPSRELWDQNGAVRFKFSTDEEFDRFLLGRCGFGLPRSGSAIGIAAAP